MSVIKNPGYEEAMTMISNSDSGTATTSHVRPFHMSKLWTSLSFHQEEHAENVLRRMQEYMESRKFCDVVLVAGVDGRRVSAHRLILAATSEYFANLFATKVQNTTETKECDNESEEEEELGTTEFADEMCVGEPEEVIFVGLLRRKGSEEEQYVTMKGRLRLKKKHEDSSECCFTGIISGGNKLDDDADEEVEETKCTKDFYNQECKKLDEQETPHEPPHCLALGPGEYYRSYPVIVSQEINSRIVKSIEALCLAAKLEDEAKVVSSPIENSMQAELLKTNEEVCEVTVQPFSVNSKPAELEVTKAEVSEATTSQVCSKKLESAPPNESEISSLVEKLKCSLKKVEIALDKTSITYKTDETSANSEPANDNKGGTKVVKIANCTVIQQEDQEESCQIVQLKNRMRGGGVSDADIGMDEPSTTGSTIYPQNAEDTKSNEQKREIKNQKQLKTISRAAEFNIKENDKPLRLSLRYENKSKEISLTGTLSDNNEDDRNDFKITRLGKELLQEQHTVKSNAITVKESLCSKKDDQHGYDGKRLGGGGRGGAECALKQHDVEKQFLIQAKDKVSYANWFTSDTSEQALQFINILAEPQSMDMLPSTSKKNKEIMRGKNASKQKFKDMLEVWKSEDWKSEEVNVPKIKKPRKDRLGSLRRKFERKEKIETTEHEEKPGITKVLPQSKDGNCEKVISKQGSKLGGKIKNLFSTQSSKREDANAKKQETVYKQNVSSSKTSTSTATMVREESSVEIKKVSIEYIAEESQTNKIIPRSWLKRSKDDVDDVNYTKVLSSISEEDELVSEECSKSENTKIEKEELKLLRSWHCLNSEKEKSSEPTTSVLPDDLDKFDISRKPINNIAMKTQDNRTLAELLSDLIKVQTQMQETRKKDKTKDTNSILDSILRQNLEDHAAAICEDKHIQQKVHEALKYERKLSRIPKAKVEKEKKIVIVPQQQENLKDLKVIKEEQIENINQVVGAEENEAKTALVSPKISKQLLSNIISQVELKFATPVVVVSEPKIEVTEVKPSPAMPQKKFQLSNVIEEKEISHVSLMAEKPPTKKNKNTFEPKKYWYTPKIDTSKAKRAKKTLPKEIMLESVNGVTLELLVNYCYTGNIELQEENTAKNVLATAGLLKLKDIVRECTNFLARKLHPSNCLGVVNFAKDQHYHRLFEEAKDYASRHFIEVCKYNEFYELPAYYLAQILCSDELNIPCEEEVFNCIMAWMQYDRETRHRDLPLLLKQLRLPLMQPSFILKYVEPVCAASTPACHRLVIDALKWHLLPSFERQSLRPLPAELLVKPRKSKVPWSNNVGKLLAVGYNISEKTITLESFAPGQNKWNITKRKRLLPGRKGNGIAVVENKILIIGGYEDWDGAKALNTVLSLDMQSLNWTLLPAMNECRYGSSVVTLNGFVYVIGGGDYYRTEFLRSVERWDSETYTWSQITPMKTKRIYAGAVVLDNLVYVVGGSNESEYLTSMECYDPFRDLWSFKASMCEPRSECGVAAAHGYIYVVGGFANGARSCTVERYNPISNRWSRVCSLETARSCCACTALGNRLLTLGGYDEIGVSLSSVEEYNINMDHWEQFPSMTSRYFSLFVMTIIDKYPKTAQCFKYGENVAQSNRSNQYRHCIVKD